MFGNNYKPVGGGSHSFGSGSQSNIDYDALVKTLEAGTVNPLIPTISGAIERASNPDYQQKLVEMLEGSMASPVYGLGQVLAQQQNRTNPAWNTYQNMPSYASSTYANALQSLLGR